MIGSIFARAVQFWHLRAIVVAVWVSVSPNAARSPDADAIADVIAQSVSYDAAPVYDSQELEAGAMARWAFEESGVRLHPRPYSWDSKAGIANGVWQIHGPAGRADLGTQAAAWLRLAHAGVGCKNPIAPLSGQCGGLALRNADKRMRDVRRVLSDMRSENAEVAQ